MSEQIHSTLEEKIALATHTPEPNPVFTDRLWQRISARSTPPNARETVALRAFHRPGWALAALILIALMIGAVIAGPQRVLAALEMGLGYIRGVGFVPAGQGMAIREPVEVEINGQSVTVEQLLSTAEEAVLTLRLRGFPPYQDIGLDHGVWLALPDGYAFRAMGYSIGVTEIPGEYIGIFKFRSLPEKINRATVIWQPQPQAAELKIWLKLYPLSDPAVRERLPESYTPEEAAVSADGITLRVDQVSSSPSSIGIRLQVSFPADFDFVRITAPQLATDKGQVYEAFPGVHFEDQGQPVQSTAIPESGGIPVRNMHNTFEFHPLDAETRRLTLTVDRISFGATPEMTIRVNLGEHPSPGNVIAVDQSFTLGELSFLVPRARLVAVESEGQSLVGLVLDIEPADPSRVQLEQIWLFDAYTTGGVLIEDGLAIRTEGWPAGELPTGEIDVKIGGLYGTLLGEWRMEWEHPQQ